ncbi:hypothetical protein [uncultured Jatrophihabitans sp.]|uniref:hypothetical protein n=1 Tax=uncultured Jatrophihabitans sp. TaxID=1610747 RepID=UPI0035CB898F
MRSEPSPARIELTAALNDLYDSCQVRSFRALVDASGNAFSHGTVANLLNDALDNPPKADRVRQFVLACRAYAAIHGVHVDPERFYPSAWKKLVDDAHGTRVQVREPVVREPLAIELDALAEGANSVPMTSPLELATALTGSLERHNARARRGLSMAMEPSVLDQVTTLAAGLTRFDIDLPRLRAALARTQLGQGNFLGANRHAEAAVAASPYATSEHMLLRGETRLNLGDLVSAAHDFEQVIAATAEQCEAPDLLVPESVEDRVEQRITAMQFSRMWIPDLQGRHQQAAAAGVVVISEAAAFGNLAQVGAMHRAGRALLATGRVDLAVQGLRKLQDSTRLAGDAGNPHLKLWEYRALAALGWGAAERVWASFCESVEGFDDGMQAHLLFEQGRRAERRSAVQAFASYEQAISIWSKGGYVNAGSKALGRAALVLDAIERSGRSREPIVLMAAAYLSARMRTLPSTPVLGRQLGEMMSARSLSRAELAGVMDTARWRFPNLTPALLSPT